MNSHSQSPSDGAGKGVTSDDARTPEERLLLDEYRAGFRAGVLHCMQLAAGDDPVLIRSHMLVMLDSHCPGEVDTDALQDAKDRLAWSEGEGSNDDRDDWDRSNTSDTEEG